MVFWNSYVQYIKYMNNTDIFHIWSLIFIILFNIFWYELQPDIQREILFWHSSCKCPVLKCFYYSWVTVYDILACFYFIIFLFCFLYFSVNIFSLCVFLSAYNSQLTCLLLVLPIVFREVIQLHSCNWERIFYKNWDWIANPPL